MHHAIRYKLAGIKSLKAKAVAHNFNIFTRYKQTRNGNKNNKQNNN